jgi:nucleotide-binding universal stress UspA family protein
MRGAAFAPGAYRPVEPFDGEIMKLTHILFPYDFSSRGKHVAPLVRSMAAQFGAKVTLYSVAPPVWDAPPEGMRPLVGDTSEEWKRVLRAQLDKCLVGELTGIDVERVADAGDPAARIRAFTETHGVDLVMLPTRGQGVFRAFLLGSVTSKVLHDVQCPVWTASHCEENTGAGLPKTILCVIDASARAVPLCRYAVDFAASIGATLRVLHVAPVVSDIQEVESERTLQERVRASAEQTLKATLRRADITVPFDVMAGEVGPSVAEYAKCEHADLVIASRGAITAPFGRFRAHTADIVTQSPCPVLNL